MVFENFFSKLTRSFTVKAQEEAEEEEIVDPQEVLRAECRETEHCQHLAEILQQCSDRVNSKKHTTETCAEELLDLLHAIDHCVTPKLFAQLK
ncbi:cytochrome b-c1 complex subunit 6, mitochondrial [Harmonia axyridis]|uniref:cytochrome b-c1 complex subunit 6, mitochondrial n=1 Tax=Harmonia axyridis TaxID=115357 RepID=UPI001E278997|nr:cytochrome b-c1 complex subunit 6, mitochondrial [Harmonia axyridis]